MPTVVAVVADVAEPLAPSTAAEVILASYSKTAVVDLQKHKLQQLVLATDTDIEASTNVGKLIGLGFNYPVEKVPYSEELQLISKNSPLKCSQAFDPCTKAAQHAALIAATVGQNLLAREVPTQQQQVKQAEQVFAPPLGPQAEAAPIVPIGNRSITSEVMLNFIPKVPKNVYKFTN